MIIIKDIDDSGMITIHIKGRVDFNNNGEFETFIRELSLETHPYIGFDLGQLEYINSLGLAVLVDHHMIRKERNETVGLYSPSKSLIRILQITNLDKILNIFNGQSEWLAYINGKKK